MRSVSRPLVSVVVPTYNRPDALRAALTSLAAQSRVADLEVLVVNDAGCDVRELVAAMASQLRVQLLDLPSNSGVAAALNAGLAQASGEWLGVCADDDLWFPDHVAIALAAADAEQADLVFTDCLVASRRVTPEQLVGGCVDDLPVAHVWNLPWSLDLLLAGDFIPIINVLFRRTPGDAIRFPSDMPLVEDWRLLLDLTVRRRYRVAHVSEPTTVYHRVPGSRSYTADAGVSVEMLQTYLDMTWRIHQAWPVPPEDTCAAGREVLLALYRQVQSNIVAESPISFFYYEQAFRLVAEVVAGRLPTSQALESLPSAVSPDGVVPHGQAANQEDASKATEGRR